MKILLVIDRIVTGGAERILVDYYHYLEKKGHKPYVFVLIGNRTQSEWTQGLRTIYGTLVDVGPVLKKISQQLKLLYKLKNVINEIQPDAIFSFLEKSNLLAILVSANDCTKVVSVHNVLSLQYTKIHNKIVRGLVYLLIRCVYNKCTNIVAVSKQVRDDLISIFHVKEQNIKIINNYVDRDEIYRKSQDSIGNFQFKTDVKYIMNIGRFSDQKAQWKLIKAFALYQKEAAFATELVLIGAGAYFDNIKKMSKDFGIENKVHVLPFDINPYKYMTKCDLFVLPSIYEGFPIVLAEVSSLRKPFVGSRKAIPEEIFDDRLIWEKCVFDSSTIKADFSLNIHEDEKALANLIRSGIEDTLFRSEILKHSKKWEMNNNKIFQFYEYDKLLGIE